MFVAGGVYTGADMAHFTAMGAAGVQLATRFITTYECDASQGYKDVLLNARPEDGSSTARWECRAVTEHPLVQVAGTRFLPGTVPAARALNHPRAHRSRKRAMWRRACSSGAKKGPARYRSLDEPDRMEAKSMKLAVLYAGQGEAPWHGQKNFSPAFRAAFDSAELDFDLHRVCFEDPDGLLNQTIHPALHGGLCLRRDRSAGTTGGVKPAYVAGLSLGEYSALEAAGVFTAKQAIELAAYRGKAMAEAAKGIDCGMTAVLNLDRQALAACCEQAAQLGCVQICNYNCPGQLVISGEKAAVDKAAALAKEAGARRCIPLKVSGPFHPPHGPAGDALAKRFASESFGEMQVPVETPEQLSAALTAWKEEL